MKRGELVTVALQRDLGKPRPALVIQSDLFDAHPSVTILPVTSALRAAPLFRIDLGRIDLGRIDPARIDLVPGARNGPVEPSQVMIDKPQSVARDKIGRRIGEIDSASLQAVNRALMVFLGLV